MKKPLLISLLASFLIGYLEWSGTESMFIFELEYDLLVHAGAKYKAFLHPFILIPFAGQVIILIALFHRKPGKKIILAGLICMSCIILFLFFIGMLTSNVRIAGSTIPFIITGILILKELKKDKKMP